MKKGILIFETRHCRISLCQMISLQEITKPLTQHGDFHLETVDLYSHFLTAAILRDYLRVAIVFFYPLMLDVKQCFKSPRGTATAGEIYRSGPYYAALASQYLGGEKNNECAFFHNVGEMGWCSSLFMSARACQSEC